MNRLFSFLVLIPSLLLGGCVSLDSLTPKENDTSFYALDTYTGSLCQGMSNGHCINLNIIVTETLKLAPIEQAYDQSVKGPNYPHSLMRILLKPSDNSYTVESLDSSNRNFRLPKNQKTDLAWDTLSSIYREIYE